MEFFQRESEQILQQLRDDQISYSDAIAALDVAFAALIPRLGCGQSRPLRTIFLANRELAIKEINRQKRARKTAPTAVPFLAPQMVLQPDSLTASLETA